MAPVRAHTFWKTVVARRSSQRQKVLADIARVLEAYPTLGAGVPGEVRSRLV